MLTIECTLPLVSNISTPQNAEVKAPALLRPSVPRKQREAIIVDPHEW
jgi:hypothetical protein